MEGFGSFFGCDEDSANDVDGENRRSLMATRPSLLPPEAFDGNIEYKLKLIDPCPARIEHLMTQMKWRIQEGNGTALYELGVEDNGVMCGLSWEDMHKSLETMKRMADGLKVRMDVINIRETNDSLSSDKPATFAAEVLVRLDDRIYRVYDVRVAVIGAADAGKSSLIGTLCSGVLDDGCGRSRLALFRHLHEVVTGRTSSIAEQTLGVDDNTGSVLTFKECQTPMELMLRCEKLVTLIDLAGHRKYMKTTLYGITSRFPNYALLLVGQSRGLVGSIIDQLNYCLFLKIPVMIVITKIDLPHDENEKDMAVSIEEELSCGRLLSEIGPLVCISPDVVHDRALQFENFEVTPVFRVSCVTGEGLDVLTNFLCLLPSVREYPHRNEDVEFQIDQIFSFRHSTLLVRGLLISGQIFVGRELFLGPLTGGTFSLVKVLSIRRMNIPQDRAYPGQTVSLAIRLTEVHSVRRKGLVLISNAADKDNVCREFEAVASLLPSVKQPQALRVGCFVTVHMNNICQTASITAYTVENEDGPITGSVTMQFQNHAEYVKVRNKLIFRNGCVRAVGTVTKLLC